MTRHAIALSALLLAAAPAAAAERNYSVTSFDRIRVDGAYSVRLTTGVAPFAKASGPTAALDGVAIEILGRTLVVRPNRSSWGGYPGQTAGPVEITLGTHELTAAFLNGSGSVGISRIKGLAFDLSVQGAGSARIGDTAVDQLKVGIAGSGSAVLGGTARKVTAVVRGTSVLDASGLAAKDATIGAEGPSTVRMNVGNSAKVSAQGVAQVELTGGPACTLTVLGSATVSGCNSR